MLIRCETLYPLELSSTHTPDGCSHSAVAVVLAAAVASIPSLGVGGG
eukprot:SAG22_NODE_12560_length_438_cov_0.761062_1_plen_46_part_10